MQAVVMIMPQGLDPADFVAKHGADGVREAAAGSRPLVEYMVRRTVARHDLSTVEGQSAAVADALPILEGLSDPVRRSEYGHMLADLAGVSESSVMVSLEQPPGRTPAEVAKTMKRATAQDKVEREMLKLLARDTVDLSTRSSSSSSRNISATRRTAGCSWRSKRPTATSRRSPAARIAKLASAVSSLAVEPLERWERRGVRAERVGATAGVPAEEQERRASACGSRR